jgi:hypothetical protein
LHYFCYQDFCYSLSHTFSWSSWIWEKTLRLVPQLASIVVCWCEYSIARFEIWYPMLHSLICFCIYCASCSNYCQYSIFIL